MRKVSIKKIAMQWKPETIRGSNTDSSVFSGQWVARLMELQVRGRRGRETAQRAWRQTASGPETGVHESNKEECRPW